MKLNIQDIDKKVDKSYYVAGRYRHSTVARKVPKVRGTPAEPLVEGWIKS